MRFVARDLWRNKPPHLAIESEHKTVVLARGASQDELQPALTALRESLRLPDPRNPPPRG